MTAYYTFYRRIGNEPIQHLSLHDGNDLFEFDNNMPAIRFREIYVNRILDKLLQLYQCKDDHISVKREDVEEFKIDYCIEGVRYVTSDLEVLTSEGKPHLYRSTEGYASYGFLGDQMNKAVSDLTKALSKDFADFSIDVKKI